jgi:geranylgeranyl transferase type-2 subunit beta
LYTASAVQILAMVDGFGELEKSGKAGGAMAVGKCLSNFHSAEGEMLI